MRDSRFASGATMVPATGTGGGLSCALTLEPGLLPRLLAADAPPEETGELALRRTARILRDAGSPNR